MDMKRYYQENKSPHHASCKKYNYGDSLEIIITSGTFKCGGVLFFCFLFFFNNNFALKKKKKDITHQMPILLVKNVKEFSGDQV